MEKKIHLEILVIYILDSESREYFVNAAATLHCKDPDSVYFFQLNISLIGYAGWPMSSLYPTRGRLLHCTMSGVIGNLLCESI